MSTTHTYLVVTDEGYNFKQNFIHFDGNRKRRKETGKKNSGKCGILVVYKTKSSSNWTFRRFVWITWRNDVIEFIVIFGFVNMLFLLSANSIALVQLAHAHAHTNIQTNKSLHSMSHSVQYAASFFVVVDEIQWIADDVLSTHNHFSRIFFQAITL